MSVEPYILLLFNYVSKLLYSWCAVFLLIEIVVAKQTGIKYRVVKKKKNENIDCKKKHHRDSLVPLT